VESASFPALANQSGMDSLPFACRASRGFVRIYHLAQTLQKALHKGNNSTPIQKEKLQVYTGF
jgi:hypothetical protein